MAKMSASAGISRARRAAFPGRAASLLLLVAFLCVPVLAAGAADAHAHDDEHDGLLPLIDIDTEAPEEHLAHITDADGDTYVDRYELAGLFQMLQSKVMAGEAALSAANDPHAGHAHAQEEAAATSAATEPTHMMSVEQILDHYAGEGVTYLTEEQFANACPALLMCAAEATCEFEHEEAHDDEDEGSSTAHLGLKLGLLAGIFFLALVGGLAPMGIKNFVQVDGVLALVNCFSGGVFMCTGLTHILPHVVEYGAGVKGYGEYPLPYVLVMLGYMLVFLVERVVFHIHKHAEEEEEHGNHGHGHGHSHGHGHGQKDHKGHKGDSNDHSANGQHSHPSMDDLLTENVRLDAAASREYRAALFSSVSVLVAISLHAVLAGVSLGMQGTRSRVGAVAVAICAHKGAAAFSVGSKFMRSGLPTAHVIALVLAFTLVTPFGIVVGILSGGATPIAKLVLEGLGAGTFIYIGATEISSDEFEMTARACDEMHGVSSSLSKKKTPDAEKAGHTHTHHSHEPPSRSARLLAFSAYGAGVFVILMSNLAPHAD